MQKIVAKAYEQETGVQLFVFGGAKYEPGIWNKIVPKNRFPAIWKYALTANKHTRNWHIAQGNKPPPFLFIDGHTHFGNVAGYINSSKGSKGRAANAM